MCYEEGVLQAFLDGELEEGKRREIKEHLEVCSRCQNIYQELKDNDVFVAEKLGGFKRAFRKNEVELKDSWNKFLIKASRVDSNKRRIIMKKWKKPLIAGVAGLVILTSLTFSPVQGIASDLLKVFRVSKLETVNLTLDDLTEIRNALSSQEGKIDLASLGKAEVVGNRENIASYEGEEAWNQLKNISDFKVKLPYYLPESIKTGSRTGGSGNSIIGIIDENGEFIPQTEGENTSQFRAFVEDGFAINFDLNV
ncbi:MAG TPA: zf-HC2 domain-containing protein, partial [Clostridia bacterium]|nr:zf-HC2 domain-containing protein [Clostridia bacterium]